MRPFPIAIVALITAVPFAAASDPVYRALLPASGAQPAPPSLWKGQAIAPVAVKTAVIDSVGAESRDTELLPIDSPMPVPNDLPVPVVFTGPHAAD